MEEWKKQAEDWMGAAEREREKLRKEARAALAGLTEAKNEREAFRVALEHVNAEHKLLQMATRVSGLQYRKFLHCRLASTHLHKPTRRPGI